MLNSILLDGILSSDVTVDHLPSGKVRATFSITYKKGHKEDAANVVYSYDPTKAMVSSVTLKNTFLGQKLRIIGSLDGITNGKVTVVAEYVEPILKEATK